MIRNINVKMKTIIANEYDALLSAILSNCETSSIELMNIYMELSISNLRYTVKWKKSANQS